MLHFSDVKVRLAYSLLYGPRLFEFQQLPLVATEHIGSLVVLEQLGSLGENELLVEGDGVAHELFNLFDG